MPHGPRGKAKVRDVPPAIAGPPKSPVGCLVSTSRQGVMVMNCRGFPWAPAMTETLLLTLFAAYRVLLVISTAIAVGYAPTEIVEVESVTGSNIVTVPASAELAK